jgi:glycosyltransferase involved in cell wall biosynthesis
VTSPLVSVVCLCYNHARFVQEAIESVLNQTYPHVELVVVDDNSTDDSVLRIKNALTNSPDVKTIFFDRNKGNCKAFNEGFRKTKGDFIIDLSGDDILAPDRIEKGVEDFQLHDQKTGVNFTDAQLIDEQGNALGFHSDRFPHDTIPQGDVYSNILSRYFINTPTMMMRRDVLVQLGGYDEALAYEDFDFWVRSSRDFNYSYTPEPLVKRRIVARSLGRSQLRKGSLQLRSTFIVCEKAATLNRTQYEKDALKKRIRYEMWQVLKLGEFPLVLKYWSLYGRI